MADLTSGIRRAAAPARPQGYKAPSTARLNPGDPSLVAQAPALPSTGGQAPAFPVVTGRHEDRSWHEMHAVEHRAYMETLVAVSLADGETLTVDPTRAQIWRVAVSGATTIVIPNPAFPDPATTRQDASERRRTWSCILIIDVPSGGTIPTISGAKWSFGRLQPYLAPTPDSDPPDWSGRHTFTFVFDPVRNDVLGFEGGSHFQ